MADINYTASIRVDKGNLSYSVNVSSVTASMTSAGLHATTYTLSGTPTNVSTAALSAVGIAFLRNLSTATATTCAIGVVSGGSMVPFASLRAGEVAVLRLSSGASYQATGTTGCRLRVDVTEG